MAKKIDVKILRSKGERLGWIKLDQAKHVTLSSIGVKGRRVIARSFAIKGHSADGLPKFLIP